MIRKLALVAAPLLLAACGSSESANEAASPDTVEMPAEEAMSTVDTAAAPVAAPTEAASAAASDAAETADAVNAATSDAEKKM